MNVKRKKVIIKELTTKVKYTNNEPFTYKYTDKSYKYFQNLTPFICDFSPIYSFSENDTHFIEKDEYYFSDGIVYRITIEYQILINLNVNSYSVSTIRSKAIRLINIDIREGDYDG